MSWSMETGIIKESVLKSIELKIRSGETLVVDEDDYEKIKDYEWETRVYHCKHGNFMFVCRSDNKRIRVHHMIGYDKISGSLSIAFLNNNTLDYRKSNVILQKRWVPVSTEKRKRKKTHFENRREAGDFKQEAPVPKNGCVIQSDIKRKPMCMQCDIYDNIKWNRCLTIASHYQWTQWSPKEKGEWCLKMEAIAKEKGKK